MLAGPPRTHVEVPVAVAAIAQGRAVRPIWRNELGGLTFEIGQASERVFVKWAPVQSRLDLASEAARLEWAHAYTRVPRLLTQGVDDQGAWIVTEALPGENAVSERWRADPATAVRAIATRLRALHEALPVETCPFSWSLEERLADIERRAAANLLTPERWHPDHRHLSVPQALKQLRDPSPVDRIVVCHGDPCAPNTLLTPDGHWSGHVDLGALGVADRWADLAVACWNTSWNYGADWTDALLEAYAIKPDPRRMAYYRLLWDLGP